MKKLISGFIAGIIVSLAVTTFAQSSSVRLIINGRDYTNSNALDVPPQIVNDRVMVPLRFVAEALDAYVDWEPNSRTVRVTSASTTSQPQAQTPTPSQAPTQIAGIASIYTASPDKSGYDESESATIRIATTKATTKVSIVDKSGSTVAESTNFSTDTEGNYFNVSFELRGLASGLHEFKVYGANAAGNASVAKNVNVRVETVKSAVEIKDVTLDYTTVKRNETVYATVKTSANVEKISVADKDGKIIKTKSSTSSESTNTWTWTINFTAEDENGTYTYYIYAYDANDKYEAEKFTVKVESTSSSSSTSKLSIDNIKIEDPDYIRGYGDIAYLVVRTSMDIEEIEVLDRNKDFAPLKRRYGYDYKGTDYYEFEINFSVETEGTYYIRAYDKDDKYVDKSFTITYK